MHQNGEYRILIGIDRDGTLIQDSGNFPGRYWPNETFELMPYVREGLRLLKTIPGVKLVMISNQTGPARGIVKEEHIPEVNKCIESMLPDKLDGMYYCPHVSEEYAQKNKINGQLREKYVRECACRKPKPGMLEQAAMDLFNAPLAECDMVFMIGDRKADVMTAINAGNNGIGVFFPSDVAEHSNLKEAIELQKQYGGKRVIVASNFLQAAVEIYCFFECNKTSKRA